MKIQPKLNPQRRDSWVSLTSTQSVFYPPFSLKVSCVFLQHVIQCASVFVCLQNIDIDVVLCCAAVIMDGYQEQPHLLDPHLGNMLTIPCFPIFTYLLNRFWH